MSDTMITYNEFSTTVEIKTEQLDDYTVHLQDVIQDKTYNYPESSLRLPYDIEAIRESLSEVIQSFTGNVEVCIVVGIGGSNNGTRAIYKALSQKTRPDTELIFVDTVSPHILKKAEKAIQEADTKEEVVLNVVSKSGTTTETIANFEVLYEKMQKQFNKPAKQVVATTDHGSPLWYKAKKAGMHTLAIPNNVGGRFSVFTPVGLFPLSLAGIDISDLLDGARDILEKSLQNDDADNTPRESAVAIESARRSGRTIDNTFFFNPELRGIGGWYRQLVGESLGKEHNTEGDTVHTGLMPVVSIGTTDLHSVGQLYFGGPRNIFTTFVQAPYKDTEVVPTTTKFELVDGIAGKEIGEIMRATYQGVVQSYKKSDLPFIQLHLPEVDAYHVGQLLQFKMLQVMYQGKLMNINAFNQPNVEGYKDETRDILTS